MHKFIMGGIAALGLAISAAPAMAETVQFTLINNSSYDVQYFYTTPSNETSWGGDLLGSDGILSSGTQGTVTIGDGSDQCVYDFKFVVDGGAETVINQVNICQLNSYTLND
ncbi:hypothetical protein [Devosia sp.]|uniref:hypothetical protein n=1 Tax=Devosia sp. TaxID=1871048 RepID=UPI003265A740